MYTVRLGACSRSQHAHSTTFTLCSVGVGYSHHSRQAAQARRNAISGRLAVREIVVAFVVIFQILWLNYFSQIL